MRTGAGAPVLVGDSHGMLQVRRFLARAAAVDAPVLILGETGTGKSLLARALHAASPRAAGPFVAVNCAAVPEPLFESELFGHRRGAFTGALEDRAGLIESSHRGTLLLDEIGELPTAQQAKLLTALEEGEILPVGARRPVRLDVRVVSATACALERRIEQGAFRRDLFHRLALLEVRMPSLRERPDDLPRLAAHFLERAAVRHRVACPSLDRRALSVLSAHGWPGNVRELGHALEAALILGGERGFTLSLERVLARRAEPAREEVASLEPAAAGASVARAATDSDARYSFYGSEDDERARIRSALDHCRGNRTRAAVELGMSRNTLRDRMRRYGL
jgi:DNA-binding NtrC family response regulator